MLCSPLSCGLWSHNVHNCAHPFRVFSTMDSEVTNYMYSGINGQVGLDVLAWQAGNAGVKVKHTHKFRSHHARPIGHAKTHAQAGNRYRTMLRTSTLSANTCLLNTSCTFRARKQVWTVFCTQNVKRVGDNSDEAPTTSCTWLCNGVRMWRHQLVFTVVVDPLY